MVNRRIVELFNVPKQIIDNDDDRLLLEHVSCLTKYPERFIEKVRYLNDHIDETSRDELEFKNGMVLERYTAPVVGRDGKCYGRTWMFRDITERIRTENALHEANRKLNLMSSMTRHDISNKVFAIKGHLALLTISQPSLASNEHLRKAEIETDQVSAMIQFSEEYEKIGFHRPIWQ